MSSYIELMAQLNQQPVFSELWLKSKNNRETSDFNSANTEQESRFFVVKLVNTLAALLSHLPEGDDKNNLLSKHFVKFNRVAEKLDAYQLTTVDSLWLEGISIQIQEVAHKAPMGALALASVALKLYKHRGLDEAMNKLCSDMEKYLQLNPISVDDNHDAFAKQLYVLIESFCALYQPTHTLVGR
jgi:hypothetical protein